MYNIHMLYDLPLFNKASSITEVLIHSDWSQRFAELYRFDKTLPWGYVEIETLKWYNNKDFTREYRVNCLILLYIEPAQIFVCRTLVNIYRSTLKENRSKFVIKNLKAANVYGKNPLLWFISGNYIWENNYTHGFTFCLNIKM